VVDFAVPDDLRKTGNSLYELKSDTASRPQPAPETRVQQGFTEASNVNVVEEMTDMITANRVFEATQHAIKAHDQMDDKLINQVGKV
jgi:flagellar basal-body rod protein FlgG